MACASKEGNSKPDPNVAELCELMFFSKCAEPATLCTLAQTISLQRQLTFRVQTCCVLHPNSLKVTDLRLARNTNRRALLFACCAATQTVLLNCTARCSFFDLLRPKGNLQMLRLFLLHKLQEVLLIR